MSDVACPVCGSGAVPTSPFRFSPSLLRPLGFGLLVAALASWADQLLPAAVALVTGALASGLDLRAGLRTPERSFLSCTGCGLTWHRALRSAAVVRAVAARDRATRALGLPGDPGWDASSAREGLLRSGEAVTLELRSLRERLERALLDPRVSSDWAASRTGRLCSYLESLWSAPEASPAQVEEMLGGLDAALARLPASSRRVRFTVQLPVSAFKSAGNLVVATPSRPSAVVELALRDSLAPDQVQLVGADRRILSSWYVPDVSLGLTPSQREVYSQLRQDGTDPLEAAQLAELLA